jgi:hypothetical protein
MFYFSLNKYKWSTKAMKMYNWLRFNVCKAPYYSWITLYFFGAIFVVEGIRGKSLSSS